MRGRQRGRLPFLQLPQHPIPLQFSNPLPLFLFTLQKGKKAGSARVGNEQPITQETRIPFSWDV